MSLAVDPGSEHVGVRLAALRVPTVDTYLEVDPVSGHVRVVVDAPPCPRVETELLVDVFTGDVTVEMREVCTEEVMWEQDQVSKHSLSGFTISLHDSKSP